MLQEVNLEKALKKAAEVIGQLQSSQPKWIPVSKMKPPAWEIPPDMDVACAENWPEYIVTIKGAKVATILHYDFEEDSSGSLIGTNPCSLKVYPSSDMAPTVTISVEEAVDNFPFSGTYVKTKSKWKITPNVTTKYNASVSSYLITANNQTFTTSSATTGYLSTAGSNTITVKVVDSRGMPITETATVTVVDYSPPRIDSYKAYRCDSSGNADDQGAYMKVTFTGTITQVSNSAGTVTNSKSVTVKVGGTAQGVTLGSGYSGFSGYTGVISADTATSYDVEIYIADSFSTSSAYTTSISTASILMNILEGKNGMAIGKMAEKTNTLQLGWDLEVAEGSTVTVHGDTTTRSRKTGYYAKAFAAAGWYRIYANAQGNASGQGTCMFTLGRNYHSPQNEEYNFSVSVGYNGQINITQLSGVIGGHLITKIRVVYKNSSAFYIDFYTNAPSSASYTNAYYVHGYGCGQFQAPTLVSSVESGYSTYEFTTVNGCKSDKGFTGDLNGTAKYLQYTLSNEINFTNGSSVGEVWFNYREPSTGASSGNTSITSYRFGNKNAGTSGVSLYADYFEGTSIYANRLNEKSISTVYGTTYTIDTYLTLISNAFSIVGATHQVWSHSWSYAGNGLLSASIGGVTHLIQLAGAHCELFYRDSANYVLKITTATTSGTTGASYRPGATYVYNTHGSAYSPTWTIEESVVAQGTSGIWNYVKYTSGIAMCWGNTGTYDTAFTATWGSWYIHDYLFPAIQFPFTFAAIPQVFASQGNSGTTGADWAIFGGGGTTTQYSPRYCVFRPKTTGATVNLSLDLFAIGKWR